MDNKDQDKEYYAFDSAINKGMRIIRWLIIVIVILVLALIGTNVAWIIHRSPLSIF